MMIGRGGVNTVITIATQSCVYVDNRRFPEESTGEGDGGRAGDRRKGERNESTTLNFLSTQNHSFLCSFSCIFCWCVMVSTSISHNPSSLFSNTWNLILEILDNDPLLCFHISKGTFLALWRFYSKLSFRTSPSYIQIYFHFILEL